MNIAPPPPPHAADLPYGTELRAGLSISTVIGDIDFETYSEAGYLWNVAENKWSALPGAAQGKKGLPVVGMAAYAMHPSTEVFTCSYNLKDGLGVRRWKPGAPLPFDLFEHLRAGRLLAAWNAGFERWIWERVCVPKYGWPPLSVAQLRCDMAKARASALPGALGKAGAVLGLTVMKDKAGESLIKKFSMPRNPTQSNPSRRVRREDDPEAAGAFDSYCDTDIRTEAEASSLIPDLPPDELEYWQIDQEINHRGVYIDLPAVENSISVIEQVAARARNELQVLTNGDVTGPTQVASLRKWLDGRGITTDTLDEDAITAILNRPLLPPDVRRVLEIRRDTASAAVKKLFAMRVRTAPDSRARDLFNYHAARTGRCTMADIQPGNLPNSGEDVRVCGDETCRRSYGVSLSACPHCGADAGFSDVTEWGPTAAEDAIAVLSTRSLDYVEYVYGAGRALPVVSSTLRGMFRAAPGHDLVVGDYSAIEAVGLAELAGEEWRREVFRTHGKIYEMSAAMITGTPFEEIMEYRRATGSHHPLRKTVGKVTELALGYGGWIGAMLAFGADAFMSEDEMKRAILAWRAASPAVVEFWGGQFRGRPWDRDRHAELYGVEGMAIAAVQYPGRWFDVRHGIAFRREGNTLYCRLPSGRLLTYHRPRLEPSERGGLSLSYEGWNTNPKTGPVGWIRIYTHGGKLTENITQATCRDLLRHASVQLERAGYPIVLHVYDEIISEVPRGFGSVEEFSALMSSKPEWASDWPVRVGSDVFRETRYRK